MSFPRLRPFEAALAVRFLPDRSAAGGVAAELPRSEATITSSSPR